MAITANRTATLITNYGADAVFHSDTPAFDPTTGTTTHSAAATHTHKVVEEGRQDRISKDADVQIYVSPEGMDSAPKAGGLVEYKGRTWTIVTIKPVVYCGDTVLYEIALRGAAL